MPPRTIPAPPPAATLLLAGFALAAAVSGCRSRDGKGAAAKVQEPPVTYRTLDASVGRVISVNERLRFVVLDYTLSQIPRPGSRLALYRSTNIIGALKLSPWMNSYTAAADFLEGTPQVGDEARPE
jgi:hypothetical protein